MTKKKKINNKHNEKMLELMTTVIQKSDTLSDIDNIKNSETKYIEKFLKLFFVGSGFYEELKEGNPDLSLKNIKVTLSAPERM